MDAKTLLKNVHESIKIMKTVLNYICELSRTLGVELNSQQKTCKNRFQETSQA